MGPDMMGYGPMGGMMGYGASGPGYGAMGPGMMGLDTGACPMTGYGMMGCGPPTSTLAYGRARTDKT
jgi:hypothetical protein